MFKTQIIMFKQEISHLINTRIFWLIVGCILGSGGNIPRALEILKAVVGV